MRLRIKLQLFLAIVSVLPITALTALLLYTLSLLQIELINQNTDLFRANLEREIQFRSHDIAKQIELYMASRPGLNTIEEFQADPNFRELAIQRIGKIGYTAIHDTDGYSRFHPNRSLENTNILKSQSFQPNFIELFTRSLNGRPVSGYYNWQEGGSIREKYMALTPIRNTNLVLAATINTDEFLAPALESRNIILSTSIYISNLVMVLSAAAVIAALLIGWLVSNSISRPLRPLIAGMSAFAAGDLSFRISELGSGEFGQLGSVFNAMARRLETQTSQLARRTSEAEQSERNQRALVENIYDLVVYISIDGRILRASPRVSQVLGYKTDELTGLYYSEIIDVRSVRTITMADRQEAGPEPRLAEFMLRALHRSGFWVDLQVSAVSFREPDAGEAVMFVCRDISKESRLERIVQLLSQSVDQAIEGILLLDFDGFVLYANHTWVKLHDLERPEEVIGRPLISIYGAEIRGIFKEINELLRNPADWSGEVEDYRHGGGSFLAHMVVTVVQDETGRPTALMIMVRDISERVRLEQELKRHSENLEGLVQIRTEELARTNARLEQAMNKVIEVDQLKSDFVAHVSHQLRTPLNSIIGFAKLLLADRSLPPTHREDIDRINQDAQRMFHFIESILALANIEASRAELDPTRFDLAESVRVVIESISQEADAKGIAIVDLVSGRDIEIFADRPKLNQVLYNLLSNAVAYTDRGEIVIGVRQSAESVTLSIKDTGRGIPKHLLEQIFDRYFGISPRGMGLGLPLAKALVEMHGGRLWVESTVGEGSIFYVQLPNRTAAA